MTLRSLFKSKLFLVLVFLMLFFSIIFYISGLLVVNKSSFHYYQVPNVEIDQIKLEVIYFVPQDQTPADNFYQTIERALKDVRNFHVNEFNSLSMLRYELYPEPVIGEQSSIFYDGDDTSRGNPGAIKEIFFETARRIFNQDGDLYDERFVHRKKDELPIRVFVYQGVGASNSILDVIISYDYLSKTDYGATTLYHEVLHNLGVPDAYDYDTGFSHADDIMGSGRTKPIAQTYIRKEIKDQMIK